MKIYDISVSTAISDNSSACQWPVKKMLLEKLKHHFEKYENFVLYHEHAEDSFSQISFLVNDMENIIFTIKLSKSTNFQIGIGRKEDVENGVFLAAQQPNLGNKTEGPFSDEDGNRWYLYNVWFRINAFEKEGKLTAFLPNHAANTSGDDAYIFGRDNFGRNYICIAYYNQLYYDSADYVSHKCEADKLQVSIDGYVYLKKNICIYKGSTLSAVTDTMAIIYCTNLGTSGNTYLNLIDISGTRYRQLKGNIWIKDKEE